MSISDFEKLRTKYLNAVQSYREVEQDRDDLKSDLEAKISEVKLLKKKIRTLCENMINKDRTRPVGEKTDGWNTFKFIEEAQKSLDSYFSSTRGVFESLLESNQERTKMIEQLEGQLKEEREKAEQDLKEKEKIWSEKLKIEEARYKQVLNAANGGTKEPDAAGQQQAQNKASKEDAPAKEKGVAEDTGAAVGSGSSFEDEFNRQLEDQQEKQVWKNMLAADAEPDGSFGSIDIDTDDEKEKERQKERDRFARYIEIAGNAKLAVIEAIGRDGKSEISEIKESTLKYCPQELKSEVTTKIFEILKGLSEEEKETGIKALNVDSVKPLKNLSVFNLTEDGKKIFSHITNATPVLSEKELIIRNHGTLEHGYGIKDAAKAIEKIWLSEAKDGKVVYLTRNKENMFPCEDGNNTIIPDIVMYDGARIACMLEYETGECNPQDFYKKCDRAAVNLGTLNVLVPNKGVKDRTLALVNKWKATLPESKLIFKNGKLLVRVITVFEMKKWKSMKEIKNNDVTHISISQPSSY